jgi:chromosome partitioning protein
VDFQWEKTVRKLLVASQKGGVGKTTSSINLAAAVAAAGGRVLLLDADPLSNVSTALRLSEHPGRRSLREMGCCVPGMVVPDLLPGLDVLSPYEDGGCSDDDFEQLLHLLATPELGNGYDCLIVDTPPFLGTNSPQLLATCDEYVVVMQAETGAYRTLPAFQELVQRSKRGDKAVPMVGILLTLPEGQEPGGQQERDLRSRFGTRILPRTIPFDAEAARARDAGQVLIQTAPDAPAARQFAALVDNLSLKPTNGRAVRRTAESPLLRAAGAFQGAAQATAQCVDLLPEPIAVPENTPAPAPARRTAPRPPPRKAPPPPPPAPTEEPDLPMDAGILMSMPEIPVLRLNGLGARKPAPPVAPSGSRKAVPGKSKSAAPESKKPAIDKPAPANTSLVLWVGLAMMLGFALRFLSIPQRLAPLFIGAAVSAAVLLLLRLVLTPSEPVRPVRRLRAATPRPAQPQTAARPEPRKEANSRHGALTRRPGSKE